MKFKSKEELKVYMSCLDVQNKCLRVRHARQYVTFTCTYPRCPFILQGKEQETNGESFVSINQFVPHDHQIGGSVPDGVPVSLFRKVYQLRVMCRQDQIELGDVRKKLDNTVGDEHKALMKKKATIVQRVKNRSITLKKYEHEMESAMINPTPSPVQLVTVATDAIREQASKDRKKYDAMWCGHHQSPQCALPVQTSTIPAIRVLDVILGKADILYKESRTLSTLIRNAYLGDSSCQPRRRGILATMGWKKKSKRIVTKPTSVASMYAVVHTSVSRSQFYKQISMNASDIMNVKLLKGLSKREDCK